MFTPAQNPRGLASRTLWASFINPHRRQSSTHDAGLNVPGAKKRELAVISGR